jgi:hypothetical protein
MCELTDLHNCGRETALQGTAADSQPTTRLIAYRMSGAGRCAE